MYFTFDILLVVDYEESIHGILTTSESGNFIISPVAGAYYVGCIAGRTA